MLDSDSMPDMFGNGLRLLLDRESDPDSPTLAEAMSGPRSQDFLEAMNSEILSTLTVIKKADLPVGTNVIPGTWALKVKRYPNGRYRKTKARFCSRQASDWSRLLQELLASTIHLLLTLTQHLGWRCLVRFGRRMRTRIPKVW